MELARRAGVLPHPGYTQYLYQLGRHTERLALRQSIQQIDPLWPRATSLYYLGRHEEAIAEYERTRGIGGDRWWEQFEHWLAIERGDPAEMNERLNGGPLEGRLWGSKAFVDALREIETSNVELPRTYFVYLGIYAARHGEIDLALDFLRAEYLHDSYAGHYMIWHPVLSDVRATEGFKTFLRDLGLVELFRKKGSWNDYCEPKGGNDFTCR